jgi:hypothetical protein
MVWFFERDNEQLQVETRYDNATLEYVVVVRRREQQDEVNRFRDSESMRMRLDQLTHELEADDWLTSGPPVFLPDGWPHRRPS